MQITNPKKKATWYNILYNGYEPDNRIKLTGELTADGTYKVFEMWGLLTFNDGTFIVSIYRQEDGQYYWRKDDETGTALSFVEAWRLMPAYVTNPDEYDETPMTYHD